MPTPSCRSSALFVVVLAACAAPEVEDSAPEVDEVARGALSFRFPLREVELFVTTVGVDHDPVDHSGGPAAEALLCTAYDGRPFPACYDEHRGSDYILEGGFDTMDAGSATIVAAAPGVVVAVEDGNYDRCHVSGGSVTCDGNPMVANVVTLEHEGGWITKYYHMMSGAMAVAVGDEVECGDPLGLVGSSGNSSQPHLHFQVESAEGVGLDPYAGDYSQVETWWVEQRSNLELPVDRCAG